VASVPLAVQEVPTFMRKTLFNKEQKEKLVDQLKRLTPGSKPGWGNLTADNLLPHLEDPLLVGLGEYEVKSMRKSFLNSRFGRWFIIYGMKRWPKSAPTAPEFDITRYGRRGRNFEDDRQKLFDTIERFSKLKPDSKLPDHPVFGNISYSTWGYVMNKHIEHHCMQFGLSK